MSDEQPRDVQSVRREKLDRLRARGVEPFALRFDRDSLASDVRDKYGDLSPGRSTGKTVKVAGRLVALRRHGQLSFAVVRDVSGDLQLMFSEEALGKAEYGHLDDLDIGDWVGAEGEVVTTKKGELSVLASSVTLLSKSLRPMPEKWHGLKDVELRLRQRYLDLATTSETRERTRARARMLRALRDHLDERGFLEVETPVLQPIPGGGLARPFVTHHEALDIPLYLRIAPELF
ncbi:MAG TPA: amino acid--tRNA ligase-related protein, partial [Actinomycetota bacterium]|nr:amino acid--tRNA ligase-related protein [Actinomycetota bacterium]